MQELDVSGARKMIEEVPDLEADRVKDAVVQFTSVENYTTFLAEFAFVGADIVVHFFPVKEAYMAVGDRRRVSNDYLLYWQRHFPQVLSPVAEEYFHATKPVLVAQYIPEMTSWFMRAGGFVSQLNPTEFIVRFFEKLDDALERANVVPAI